MKKKRLLACILCMASLLLLIGCSNTADNAAGNTTDNTNNSSGTSSDTFDVSSAKIAVVLPGSIDDQSWNASNYAGAKAIESEYGITVDIIESCAVEDFDATFTEFGEKEYDLVLAAGSQFDDSIANIAPNYPNTLYTAINGVISNTENMCPVYPREYEASYLAGIVAGYATENGQFATMGGSDAASMTKCLDCYDAAAIKVATERGIENPSVQRAYINSLTDIALTKSTTDQMIDNGADTVHCYSNEGQSGAVQSCQDKGAKFIAFAGNKNGEADCVIASAYADLTKLYPWIVDTLLVDGVRGYTEAGLADGIITIEMTDQVSEECRAAVEKASEEIINGTIKCEDFFVTNVE